MGKPLPMYTESGECLFCHRNTVGATWGKNRHNRTIRDAEAGDPAMAALRADLATKELAEQVQLILGGPRAARFLRRAKEYGHADLLSVRAIAIPGALAQAAVATPLGMAVGWWRGWTPGAGLVFGPPLPA